MMVQIPTPKDVLAAGGDSLVNGILEEIESYIWGLNENEAYFCVRISAVTPERNMVVVSITVARVIKILQFRGWVATTYEEGGELWLRVSQP